VRNNVRIRWHEVGYWMEVDYECRIDISDSPGYPLVNRIPRGILFYELVDFIANIIWFASQKGARPPVFKLPGLHINVDLVTEEGLTFHAHTPSWLPFLRRTVIKDLIVRHKSRERETSYLEMRNKTRRLVANSLLTLPSLVFANKTEMWKEAMGVCSPSENSR